MICQIRLNRRSESRSQAQQSDIHGRWSEHWFTSQRLAHVMETPRFRLLRLRRRTSTGQ